ncbi:39S ribosomal protein L53, mitochondrial-like [Mercenaria mercenaria]|uniref:39S ribosomal protein L53, mitochondrial-like n=1 Tax=Mercenaria mercenaria TaxID=6596 RepID=UPI001E1D9717|nr:39S ribosomal protein L53, mitochondrial-like [Mercenaria mercenaria]
MPALRPKYFSDGVKVGMLLKKLHIRPVAKIQYTFDPFTENVASIRSVINCLNTKSVLSSSVALSKINVQSDRCEPKIDVEFSDGHKLIFKTEHLKASEILEKLLFYCNQKDTTQPEADVALTKMSGKPKGKKKK